MCSAIDVEQLHRDGYAVAEQVVPRSIVDALLGLAGALPVWGHQAQWDARQHPAVHGVFAAAYGMQPPGFWRGVEQERADRIELHESGRANPHYRHRPGHDRVEPWPPATLTPLGRRLLGADPWP